MKVAIIGTGAVGSACALALTLGGAAREIVLLDRRRIRAKAVATDLRYGAPLAPRVEIRDGDYADLAGAALVMITAGVNEKAGGAADRGDPAGRLRLLETNIGVFHEVVPQAVAVAPEAVLLVVTDPPDPLADLARHLAGHDRVVSTGTFLDSLRFRVHLAQRLGVSPASVEALVVGEHGTSQVFLWSAARLAGVALRQALAQRGLAAEQLEAAIEEEVRYANITIIEGNEASQLGIGMVAARIAEAVLRDEGLVLPVGSHNREYGVTLSLPSVIGRHGVSRVLAPEMSAPERQAVQRSADALHAALRRSGIPSDEARRAV